MKFFYLIFIFLHKLNTSNPNFRFMFLDVQCGSRACYDIAIMSLLSIVIEYESSNITFVYEKFYQKIMEEKEYSKLFKGTVLLLKSIFEKNKNGENFFKKQWEKFCCKISKLEKMELKEIEIERLEVLYGKILKCVANSEKNVHKFVKDMIFMFFWRLSDEFKDENKFADAIFKIICGLNGEKFIEVKDISYNEYEIFSKKSILDLQKQIKNKNKSFFFEIRLFEIFFYYFFDLENFIKNFDIKRSLVSIKELDYDTIKDPNYTYDNILTQFVPMSDKHKRFCVESCSKNFNNYNKFYFLFLDWDVVSDTIEFHLRSYFHYDKRLVTYFKELFIIVYKKVYFNTIKIFMNDVMNVLKPGFYLSNEVSNKIRIYKCSNENNKEQVF